MFPLDERATISKMMKKQANSKIRLVIKTIILCLSALLVPFCAISYWFRPDLLAGVTFWPAWIWALPGMLLLGLGTSRKNLKAAACVGLLWLIYLGTASEESWSLLRRAAMTSEQFAAARSKGEAVRVITLNCAGGSILAAAEVTQYNPDIVLLQESPSQMDVLRLAEKLFGDDAAVVWGTDGSIIVKGEAAEHSAKNRRWSSFTGAKVKLKSGPELNVLSVRFQPPDVGIGLWSSGYWRANTAKRKERREEVRQTAQHIDKLPRSIPVIVGGDFNAPGGDSAFSPLRPRLHDTFDEGGLGWGNTVLNELPVLRYDQVWVSDDLKAVAVVAKRTNYSDHRIVICDLMFR